MDVWVYDAQFNALFVWHGDERDIDPDDMTLLLPANAVHVAARSPAVGVSVAFDLAQT